MEQIRKGAWQAATLLAKMDDQTQVVSSLPRKSRFVVIVLLGFCFVSFVFLYTSSNKPTVVRPIEELKKAWNMGQYRQHDNQRHKHESPPEITHAQSSTYRFAGSSGIVISKGATLRLEIEARDLAGKRTTKGGDMWYATLNSLKPKASKSGKVVDNGDGTYDVSFCAGWVGVARIDIVLVHPKEACSFVEETVWPTEDRMVWQGTFRVKGRTKTRAHTATCVMRRNDTDWANMCEYWYPKELGDVMLLCGKPDDKATWACSDLYSLKSLNARIVLAASELIEGKEYLFEQENVMQIVEGGPKHVKLEVPDEDDYTPAELPPCQPGLPAPEVEGFWLDDKWHSLRCQNPQWGRDATDAVDPSPCLRGKEVYFLGDATTRSWFETFHDAIGLKFFLRNDDAHFRFFRHHPSLNLSVVYQAHTLLSTSAKVPFEEVQFEVDALDSLQNPKCNYIVLLSPWHFTNWDRASLVERLGLLKEAIGRLIMRCPEARVVVRGPHPVAHGTFASSFYGNNIVLRGIRDLMIKTFRGTGASFLDVWDMSLAYPSPNTLHMPPEVVRQEVNLFMSYVCKIPKKGAK